MATPHVYFSRQMVKAKYKDPKTLEYRDYKHSRATGKDGKPLLMYRILLPSANHRKLQFPKDVNGIDVNSRKAYIQVPRDAVHDTKIAHKKVMYMDCETSTWTVYFEAQRLRDADGHPIFTADGKNQFDKPVPVKLNRKQMAEIFDTKLIREKKKEVSVEKDVKKTTQKEKTKNIDKNVEQKQKNKPDPEMER